jgi:hypothetical protein
MSLSAVRLACLLTFTASRATQTYRKLCRASASGHGIHAFRHKSEIVTYSTGKGNEPYPYRDRRRIGDSFLDGHLEQDASSAPRNVRRVAERSRPLVSSNQRGVEKMMIRTAKREKDQNESPSPHDDENLERNRNQLEGEIVKSTSPKNNKPERGCTPMM